MSERPTVNDPGRIIAHRGASRIAPENTLAAFRAAAGQGARWIEFDASLLGDGTAVVFHDATLDRCTDATGPLTAIARADLARIHAGARHGAAFAVEPLPTLEATLDLIEELGLHANLELKTHPEEGGAPPGATAAAVASALAARGWAAGRIVVSSFDIEELAAFRAARADMAVAALWEEPPPDWPARLAALNAEAIHLDWTCLTHTLLDEARARGLRVRVYTCNEPAALAPFRDRGLTGVITDHPPLYLADPAWAAWARS